MVGFVIALNWKMCFQVRTSWWRFCCCVFKQEIACWKIMWPQASWDRKGMDKINRAGRFSLCLSWDVHEVKWGKPLRTGFWYG
jgi:hypothetical protein